MVLGWVGAGVGLRVGFGDRIGLPGFGVRVSVGVALVDPFFFYSRRVIPAC